MAYQEAYTPRYIELHRQVGALAIDERGIARRGLLVRHLVMPGALEDTASIMLFLAHKVSAHTYVNILGQYFPAGKVSSEKFPEINRGVTGKELEMAYALARQAGLYRFGQRVPRRQMMAL